MRTCRIWKKETKRAVVDLIPRVQEHILLVLIARFGATNNMAVEAILQLITIPAGADLSSNQFCTVFVDTDGTAKLAAEDKNADGILQNNPKQTEACAVAVFGISKAKIGDNVTVGRSLEVGT